MENEFINYLDSIIKQLEILKINAKKEIESEYFNLYCIIWVSIDSSRQDAHV